MTPALKIRCGCGAQIEIPETYTRKDSDKITLQFDRMHSKCQQEYIRKTQAEERRASMFQIRPGEVVETISGPDYTEALNKIAEHLSNIEMNVRRGQA